jgi:hypothetical protein
MKRLSLRDVLALMEDLTWTEARIGNRRRPFDKRERASLLRKLVKTDKLCTSMALATSVQQVAHVRAELKRPRPNIAFIQNRIHELRKRIHDELGSRYTFFLSLDEEKAFLEDRSFGQDTYDAFPDARIDITEAARCLALERYTASVCHLMRVLEIGLKVVATKLGIPDPIDAQRNWGNMLNTIQRTIEIKTKTSPPDPYWANIRNHAEQAHAFLSSVKLAWRNPTMHVQNHYEEGEAKSISSAVGGFMRQVVFLK